ncbi:MAG: nucleotidyltransferase [Candidatus Methylomirabilia bacterium]
MDLPLYFTDFLRELRLTGTQINDLRIGHRTLRKQLEEDAELAPMVVASFLHGSYRRATAVRAKESARARGDVMVVTRLDRDGQTPAEALKRFVPFLERHYGGQYETRGRSFRINLAHVDLDLVITAAPIEAEAEMYTAASVTTEITLEEAGDWRLVKSWVPPDARSTPDARMLFERAAREDEWMPSPLYVPDREVKAWTPTQPFAQLQWTRDKNQRCSGHYVNVVKAIKWWRIVNLETLEQLTGYPIEHLVGACCPDGIGSVGAGVTRTLQEIAARYAPDAAQKRTPDLPDHGVSRNVLRRMSGEDFAAFHARISQAAETASGALASQDPGESAEMWGRLFGEKFPTLPADGGGPRTGGYTPRKEKSIVGGGRYA